MDENNKANNPKKQNLPKGKKKFNIYWVYLILTVILFVFYFSGKDEKTQKEIEKGQLIELLETNQVTKIELINKEKAEIYVTGDDKKASYTYRIGSLERFEEDVEQVQKDKGISKDKLVYITNVEKKNWGLDLLLTWILPFAFIIALWLSRHICIMILNFREATLTGSDFPSL